MSESDIQDQAYWEGYKDGRKSAFEALEKKSKMAQAANAIADALTNLPPQSGELWWTDLIKLASAEIERRRAARKH